MPGKPARRTIATLAEAIEKLVQAPWEQQVDFLYGTSGRDLEVFLFHLINTRVSEENRDAFEHLKLAVYSIIRDYREEEARDRESGGGRR